MASTTFDNQGNFYLYPNPVTSRLQLVVPNEKITKSIITDITGKKILEVNGKSNSIDVEKLQSGIYFIQVFTEERKYESKFIRQ